MDLKARIEILLELRSKLNKDKKEFNRKCDEAYQYNNWFTRENIDLAIDAVKSDFLDEAKLTEWIKKYKINDIQSDKLVGLVMAGNIPLVGFHDLICVFIAGHNSRIKLSSKDEVLMNYIVGLIHDIEPETKEIIKLVERLGEANAVIATGSNNSYRYFDYYFGKIPNIIRKNRNSVAVLTGDESEFDLKMLAFDIQSFFGLGCRNISKIFVPHEYKFDMLIESLNQKYELRQHHKYMNNYDYNLAVSLMNKDEILQSENIILKKASSYISGIAMLNYEEYNNVDNLSQLLDTDREQLQLISSLNGKITGLDIEFVFGQTQHPQLWDYADGIDTMTFLTQL
ncbi:MAG: acyl-CoA reductase [Deltaproteobacteria bacterium]